MMRAPGGERPAELLERSAPPDEKLTMRPPLLFVPGFNCTAALWAPQLARFAGAFDCRVADATRADSMQAIAAQILADAPTSFALAGLSMGGYIAFEIMRQAPERVTRLALLDTQATPESDQQRVLRAARVETAKRDGIAASADIAWPNSVHPARYEDIPLRDLVLRMALDTGLDAFLRQAAAITSRPDSRPSLSAIRAPTLVLVGEQDALTPPDKAKEIADAIPGAKLKIVPHCGHLSSLEMPESVNAALADFLG